MDAGAEELGDLGLGVVVEVVGAHDGVAGGRDVALGLDVVERDLREALCYARTNATKRDAGCDLPKVRRRRRRRGGRRKPGRPAGD